ncbi:MAG: response regulator, partial [Bacteroidota bacterium]
MKKALSGLVLAVDDDPDILLTARLVLQKSVSAVQTTNDPHRIEQLLAAEHIHMILLDMNFTAGFTSGKEGLRWLKKIKKLSPQTEVILMTAYGDIDLAVRGMQEGARDFVVKPWDND